MIKVVMSVTLPVRLWIGRMSLRFAYWITPDVHTMLDPDWDVGQPIAHTKFTMPGR